MGGDAAGDVVHDEDEDDDDPRVWSILLFSNRENAMHSQGWLEECGEGITVAWLQKMTDQSMTSVSEIAQQ